MADQKSKPVTPENMRHLAENLIDFFAKEEVWSDMCVYVDGEAWKSDNYKKEYEKTTTRKGTEYYVKKDVDIAKQLEYSNPKTVTITFEGPLYDIINNVDYDYADKLSDKFLKEYGLYFEQGYAWSMAAYS
jgi:hypothetical protein